LARRIAVQKKTENSVMYLIIATNYCRAYYHKQRML